MLTYNNFFILKVISSLEIFSLSLLVNHFNRLLEYFRFSRSNINRVELNKLEEVLFVDKVFRRSLAFFHKTNFALFSYFFINKSFTELSAGLQDIFESSTCALNTFVVISLTRSALGRNFLCLGRLSVSEIVGQLLVAHLLRIFFY